MQTQNSYDVIYTHTEGEPLCIIHSGIPYVAGSTILEKRVYLEREYDWLRKALMREPRGHRDMFGVFLTPPSSPDYDAGMIYIDGTQYSHMCGHGTIALSMAMVALGMVPRGKRRRGLSSLKWRRKATRSSGHVLKTSLRMLRTRTSRSNCRDTERCPRISPGVGTISGSLICVNPRCASLPRMGLSYHDSA